MGIVLSDVKFQEEGRYTPSEIMNRGLDAIHQELIGLAFARNSFLKGDGPHSIRFEKQEARELDESTGTHRVVVIIHHHLNDPSKAHLGDVVAYRALPMDRELSTELLGVAKHGRKLFHLDEPHGGWRCVSEQIE